MKHKLESRFLGEISITSDVQMTLALWQKSEEELKSKETIYNLVLLSQF